MVERSGFEPPNQKELSYSQPRLATSLLSRGCGYRNCTCDLQVMSLMRFYFSNPRCVFSLAGAPGFEPGKCQIQSLMPYRLAMLQFYGREDRIRTYVPMSRPDGLAIRSLKPLEYFSKMIYGPKLYLVYQQDMP